jgi:alkaline phosphatase D
MEERRLDRREFLLAGVATGIAVATPLNYAAIARAKKASQTEGAFLHGVSAGAPESDAIELWTRLSELDRNSHLTLEVARDSGFGNVVRSHQVQAHQGDDFTVHSRVAGLQPDSEYFYRFHTGGADSPVGRFRTLPPPDSNRPIRIGFFSCQSYEAGYYTAHAALSQEPDLDLVLCLGDYIYERHFYPGPAARADTTGVNGDGDVQTLAEYRQKYRLYQTDPNLQAVQAAYPLLAIWDDHEVEDNYAGDGPDSIQPNPELENNGAPRRVPFEQRRRNGYQAFFESIPRQRHQAASDGIYGSLRLGNLVELFLTDERQYRDPQPCNDHLIVACPDDEAPGRTMLGDRQKRWFKRAVESSPATWKLWGSEVMVMSLDTAKATATTPGAHANPDQWDGYSAERKEILGEFVDNGVRNLAVLSGDIHTFFAGNLTTTGGAPGQPAGAELVGGSITSLGLPEATGIPSSVLQGLRQAVDPHIVYADFDHRGYCVVTVSQDELIGEFKSVSTIQQPTAASSTLARFRVPSGSPSIEQI